MKATVKNLENVGSKGFIISTTLETLDEIAKILGTKRLKNNKYLYAFETESGDVFVIGGYNLPKNPTKTKYYNFMIYGEYYSISTQARKELKEMIHTETPNEFGGTDSMSIKNPVLIVRVNTLGDDFPNQLKGVTYMYDDLSKFKPVTTYHDRLISGYYDKFGITSIYLYFPKEINMGHYVVVPGKVCYEITRKNHFIGENIKPLF